MSVPLKRALCFAIGALLLSPSSWAGRPFTTEDAGVIAAGDCELESFGAHAPSERGGRAQVGCGLGWNTQLALGAGRSGSGDESSTAAALTGKTALRPLGDEGFGIALAYAIEGSKPAGRPLRHTGSAAALVVSVPRGRTITHANVGLYRKQLERETVRTYALAIERLGEGGIDVGAEVFGEGRESPWIGAGARLAIKREKLFVDLSIAAQRGSSHARQWTAGLKLAF